MITTTNFAKFGNREKEMAKKLLDASTEQGFPDNFYGEGVQIMMNTFSNNVFFKNESYQVCMMNGDKLEMFYRCPYCSHEGFLEDMEHDPKDKDCTEYMKEIGVELDESDDGQA